MDLEQELQRVAEIYTRRGYQVTLRPRPDHLPFFAQGFNVEIVGKRGAEGVLVAVKKDREELAADANMLRYAEITATQPGWRFDFAILEGESPLGRLAAGAVDFSGEDITQAMAEADQMVRMGFIRAAVIAAWAGLEAAMRMRLRAAGEKAGWGTTPPGMLNELYSAGIFSPEEFRRLEGLSQLRNQIVHGFSSPTSDAAVVQFLTEMAQRLLKESQLVKQPA